MTGNNFISSYMSGSDEAELPPQEEVGRSGEHGRAGENEPDNESDLEKIKGDSQT